MLIHRIDADRIGFRARIFSGVRHELITRDRDRNIE